MSACQHVSLRIQTGYIFFLLSKGIFKIEDSAHVARLWGIRKNRPAMNYDKLSRSIRQYYKKGIIRKPDVSRRLVYQFVNPVWWRGSADLKRMCQGAPKDMLDILYSRGNMNSEARSFVLCIWCLISIVKTAYWTTHSCLSYNIILLYYS